MIIQSIIPLQKIRELALKAGWLFKKEDIIGSPMNQENAEREAGRVLSEGYRVRYR